jgi:hypothetical protein
MGRKQTMITQHVYRKEKETVQVCGISQGQVIYKKRLSASNRHYWYFADEEGNQYHWQTNGTTPTFEFYVVGTFTINSILAEPIMEVVGRCSRGAYRSEDITYTYYQLCVLNEIDP